MNKIKLLRVAGAALIFLTLGAQAQDKVPAGSFAVVNGTALSKELVEQVIRNNQAQGAQPTADSRKLIESELAGRAALSQEALKRGLDKSPTVKVQLELFLQNLLAEALISDHQSKNPIEESVIKADYERQIKLLKDSKEYKIRDIVVADEAQAKAIVASLRKGESFEKLAQDKSIDASKSNGGDLGWLLVEQITPAIGNVVVNLAKGATTMAPIQVGNTWHVLKLEDVRPFTAPTYDVAKVQIRQALMLKQRNEFVSSILSNAKIELVKP